MDSYIISHDEFISVNNVLREYDIKEDTKNLKTSAIHHGF